MAKVFLFPLNVSVSPCFHHKVLVPVYRVYTSRFHNTVVRSCYRLHTSCLHHAGVTSCFSLNMWFYSWNVSLVRSWWESAHIQFNLWSVYYDVFMMGLGANFTMEKVAFSANSFANCHYDIHQDTLSTNTQFLEVIGFHGFILIVFSLPDSILSS